MNWLVKLSQIKEPWQLHKDEYAPYPQDLETDENGVFTDEGMRRHQEHRKKIKEWESNTNRAISLGKLSPDDAKSKGYRRSDGSTWEPLPSILYHVTTAKSKVIQEGLKTRLELDQIYGKGLGGGESDTISFTADINIAQGIYDSIINMRLSAAGEITISQMLDEARQGKNADKPFLTELVRYKGLDQKWKLGDPIPAALDALLRGVIREHSSLGSIGMPPKKGRAWRPADEGWTGGDGIQRHTLWERSMTPEEEMNARAEFFKAFITFREYAGGPFNPLFFLSDPAGLVETPEEEIAILIFKPKQGAHGYRVNALGEWRVPVGEAVELVGEVDN